MPGTSADRPGLAEALAALNARLASAVLAGAVKNGELDVRLTPDGLVPALRLLRDEHGFNAFEDLAVFDNLHAPAASGARFTAVYRLYRFPGAARARLAVDAGEGESLPSAVELYAAADWAEREAYDMFGVRFEGHPCLRRIYMPDGFEGHPLRKDFPLAGRPDGV
jgi:NADH:ubiquinone oxidoreductase subunit C